MPEVVAQPEVTLYVRQFGADQQHEVHGAPNDLPRLVAELVDLGPRPYEPDLDGVLLPVAVLDAYAGAGMETAELAELADDFDGLFRADHLQALLGERSIRWQLAVQPSGGVDADASVVDVVDAGAGGLWLLTPAEHEGYADATPVTATAVWLLLAQAVAPAA